MNNSQETALVGVGKKVSDTPPIDISERLARPDKILTDTQSCSRGKTNERTQ